MKRSNISNRMAMALPSQAAIREQSLCEVKEWHRKIPGKEHSRLFRTIGNHLVNIPLNFKISFREVIELVEVVLVKVKDNPQMSGF